MVEHTGGNKSGRRVKAVNTTCTIIEGLRELDGAGVSELADHLGISKGAVHSHLATLVDNEFVVQRGDTYNVGLRFVDFGEYAKNNVPVYSIAKQEVDRLAEETGEVAQLMLEEHGKGVYLHKARGPNAIQTASYTGYRKHLHCTALGKSILAQFSHERVEEIMADKGMPQRTPNTITNTEDLFAELERIREENVAYDDEEILEGMRCVAAPLTHPKSGVLGAISVSGPTSRFKGERLREELPEAVQSAANVITVNATQA